MRLPQLETRHVAATGWRLMCRKEESRQLDQWHDDREALAKLRHSGIAAFRNTLDVTFNPQGVAEAFLRELAHVLTDLPSSLHLPPPHVLPRGLAARANASGFAWLWT